MKRLLLLCTALIGSSLCAAPTASASNTALPAGVVAVETHADGAFLENIDVTAAGDLYYTDYFRRTVHRRTEAGRRSSFGGLPVFPTSVLVLGDRLLIAGPKIAFTDGPQFATTNHLVWLDTTGRVLREIAVPQARFLNGMTRLSERSVLIADSILGVIWRYDTEGDKVTEWLKHDLLTPDPAAATFQPGANGVKLAGDWLYVSNSSRGAIYRARVQGQAADATSLAVFARTGQVDDFVVLPEGGLVAASHADHLLAIDRRGEVKRLMDHGCGGCTAVGLRPGTAAAEVFVLTTGHLLEGRKEPARVLRVPLPRTP